MSFTQSCRGVLLGLALSMAASANMASPVAYSGVFLTDDALFSTSFAVNTGGLVTVNTLSYAGGVGSLGGVVAAGGFAPELSLFDQASGLLIQLATPGTCATAPTDATTGFAWDVCFSADLVAGNYLLVLSQSGNDPLGGIADGFSMTGQADFTGLANLGTSAMFIDLGGAQRDGHWAFDLALPDVPTQSLPEPSSLALLLAALIGVRGAARSRPRA